MHPFTLGAQSPGRDLQAWALLPSMENTQESSTQHPQEPLSSFPEMSAWHSQCCSKGSGCSTTPEDGCGVESGAAFRTEQDTARTASLRPQRSFSGVLQSTNKIQSIIKSVKLQSLQQSSNNNGSQAIPLFKKSDFMAYPNLNYWRDHCSFFASLKPLIFIFLLWIVGSPHALAFGFPAMTL